MSGVLTGGAGSWNLVLRRSDLLLACPPRRLPLQSRPNDRTARGLSRRAVRGPRRWRSAIRTRRLTARTTTSTTRISTSGDVEVGADMRVLRVDPDLSPDRLVGTARTLHNPCTPEPVARAEFAPHHVA